MGPGLASLPGRMLKLQKARRPCHSHNWVENGPGDRPKLNVDTKGSLSTSGQAQATAGSTPTTSDWAICLLLGPGEGTVQSKHELFISRTANPWKFFTTGSLVLKTLLFP